MGGRGSNSEMGGGSIQDKISRMSSYAGADPGDVKNLIPLASESDIRGASRLLATARKEGTLSYTEKEVSINSLETRQEWVTQNKLSSMAEDFTGRISGSATSTDGGIRVVPFNDQLIVIDGNHRINLAILKGQKRINVRIAEVGK